LDIQSRAAIPPCKNKARPVNGSPGRAIETVVIGSGGRLLLPLALLAEQLHHAGMRRVRELHQHQQVIAPEAAGALPFALVRAVEALERNVEARAAFAFVPPDCGLDAADADFLDRLNFVLFLRHDSAPF
jgi:hypothetical protein